MLRNEDDEDVEDGHRGYDGSQARRSSEYRSHGWIGVKDQRFDIVGEHERSWGARLENPKQSLPFDNVIITIRAKEGFEDCAFQTCVKLRDVEMSVARR